MRGVSWAESPDGALLLRDYLRGDVSLGWLAERLGISHWELIDDLRSLGVAHSLRAADIFASEEQLPSRRPGT